MRGDAVRHAMSIDVEDYFHVAAFSDVVKADDWGSIESRVERNTRRALELFDKHNVQATFFVLGWVAERYPDLVRAIAAGGHEVASHGYSHQLIYKQTPEVFRAETRKSKQILEDIVQRPIVGYRAASYSITPKSRWALDILHEEGFVFDSSLFPVRHDRYGMPDANPDPHVLTTPSGGKLIEFTLSTLDILGYRLPMAGGGYFRLFPYWFTKACLTSLQRRGRPFIFYLHPWELDPQQPRFENASALSRFRHYNNLDQCERRFEQLLKAFRFTTVSNVLADLKLLPAQH
jgi:polysaccharide deacetylase family protein (PEP-CTERM system associated)